MCNNLLLVLAVTALTTVSGESYTPIVLWHGMGDSCCNPMGMGSLIRRLQESLPDVHILSLKIGNTRFGDTLNSFLMHPNRQVEMACDAIRGDPQLANGYNAIGYSQGSQFLRALAQRCPEPKMKTLVSVGGQHQGVYGLPRCDAATSWLCDKVRPLVSKLAYTRIVQETLVQATYWHDPLHREAYLKENTFLADINNELSLNQTYINNLQSLENIILIKFENDSMVQPKESAWFGFYKSGQTKEKQSLQESEVYIRLGLDKMDADGKLHFLSTAGEHLQLQWSWFLKNVVKQFLK